MALQLVLQSGLCLVAGSQSDKRDYTLALHFVGSPNDSSLRNRRMADQRTLYLHGSDTMAGYVDHVVNPTHDPQVTILIAASSVAGEIHSRNLAPVLLFVT